MRIVHVAAEFAPIAKAGGLGEVVLGLSRELTKMSYDVEVILPKYDFIDLSQTRNLQIEAPEFQFLGYKNAAWRCDYKDCKLHLLESRHPAGYFHRGKIYGDDDDISRFIYFSRAVLEYLALENKPIDVLHLHDWHVSLCAPLVKNLFSQLNIRSIVLTIHNLEHQGKCAIEDLNRIGLDGSFFLKPYLLQDDNPKYPESINLLKGGIVFSDAIVPVSPTYAKEILTPQYGQGLDQTLNKVRTKIHGVLNGIDMKSWDTKNDPNLNVHYASESIQKGKNAAKKQFPLSSNKRPWVGAITRIVPQKGPELIEEAIQTTLKLNGSFLLLGSSPIPKLQSHFEQLSEKYRDNPHVFFNFTYDEHLAHEMYAALDFLIVPSRFEPCGLTQMIGMLYGAVPIVRQTGGLKDTVFDFENSQVPSSQRNGFIFLDPTKKSMNETIQRAIELFRKDPASYQALQKRGMQSDFSWKKPALKYMKIYQSLLKRALDVYPIRVNVVAN